MKPTVTHRLTPVLLLSLLWWGCDEAPPPARPDPQAEHPDPQAERPDQRGGCPFGPELDATHDPSSAHGGPPVRLAYPSGLAVSPIPSPDGALVLTHAFGAEAQGRVPSPIVHLSVGQQRDPMTREPMRLSASAAEEQMRALQSQGGAGAGVEVSQGTFDRPGSAANEQSRFVIVDGQREAHDGVELYRSTTGWLYWPVENGGRYEVYEVALKTNVEACQDLRKEVVAGVLESLRPR